MNNIDKLSPIKLNIAEKLEKNKKFRERFFRGHAKLRSVEISRAGKRHLNKEKREEVIKFYE